MAMNLAGRTQAEPHSEKPGAPRGSLRDRIRQAVHTVEPDAQIILYGSRARGNAGPESDWDLLVLVDGPVNGDRKSAIRHRLYEVEWDFDEVLTSIIFSREDWNSPLYRAMPFHQNVDRDGVSL